MAQLLILGPRALLGDVIGRLQIDGVLHLRTLPDEIDHQRIRRVPLAGAEVGVERMLEERARRIQDLLLLLPGAGRAPASARAPDGAGLPDVGSPDFLSHLGAIETNVAAVTRRRIDLEEERDLLARYERLLTVLVPLRPTLSEVERAETMGLLVRRDRPEVLGLIEERVRTITGGVYRLASRDVDREQTAVLLTVPASAAADLSRLLFERGIAEIKLPERYAGRPLVETLALLLRRMRELPGEIQTVERDLASMTGRWAAPLRTALGAAHDRLVRLRAIGRCGETSHAFIVCGWVPAARSGALAHSLEESFEGRVAVIERPIREEERDEVPVILENAAPIRPFELLLSVLPPPRYGSIDPTPWLAVFFPIFFGVMLGDAGLGTITLGLALVARTRGWGGETGRQLAGVALACSVSAIAFGILFGELLGETGAAFGFRPLLFDRRQATLPFLGLALGLGAVHVVVGISLAAWSALRRRGTRDALAKSATLALILTIVSGGAALMGYLPPGVARGALVALGPLLVLAIVLEGFLAPLELIRALGNILSYARLMALGLASVMLAEVAHRMATLLTPPALGVTMAVLLHAVNYALGLVSPTIQALRLHYVEFFDKFYEPGGTSYEPLRLTR